MRVLLSAFASFSLCLAGLAAAQTPTDRWQVRLETSGGQFETFIGEAHSQPDGTWRLEFTETVPSITIPAGAIMPLVQLNGNVENGFSAEIPSMVYRIPGGLLSGQAREVLIGDTSVSENEFFAELQDIDKQAQWSSFLSVFSQSARQQPLSLRIHPANNNGRIAARDGARFFMQNPVRSENGNRIEWSWSVETVSTDDIVSIEGGPAQGTALIWERPTQIDFIFVANAQSATSPERGTLYPRPEETDPNLPRATVPGPAGSVPHSRELILIGRGLSALDGQVPSSDAPGLVYGAVRPFDAAALSDTLGAYDPAAINLPSLAAAARAAGDGTAEVRSLGVDISAPIPPGPQSITFDLAEGRWPLRFGEVLGQIRVLRPERSAFLPPREGRRLIPSRATASTRFVFREELVFETYLDTVIDSDTVRVEIEPPAGATLPPDTVTEIALTRSPQDRQLFRSESFLLADAVFWRNQAAVDAFNTKPRPLPRPLINTVAETYADLSEDSTIALPRDSILRPIFAPGQNLEQVTPLPDGPVTHADTTIQGDFVTALERAHACNPNGDAGTIDWDRLSLQEASTLSLNRISAYNIMPVTYGQHAALLIARARLREIVEQDDVRREIDLSFGNRRSKGFLELVEQYMLGQTQALRRIEVYPQFAALADRRNDFARLSPEVRRRLLPEYAQLTMAHLTAFRDARIAALEILQTTDDCDIRGLIRVGIDGIDPIIHATANSLTRQQQAPNGPSIRRPDTVGRREMLALPDLFERYNTRLVWAEAEWLYVKGAITVAGLALGGVGVFAAAAGATGTTVTVAAAGSVVVDTFDVMAACTDYYCGATDSTFRRSLAVASAEGLGGDRADTVLSEEAFNHLAGMLDVAMAGAGAYFSAADLRELARTRAFAPAAQSLLAEAATRAAPSVAERQKARRVVKSFLDQLSEDPNRIANLAAHEREAILATLRDTSQSPLPAALRALLNSGVDAPAGTSAANRFIHAHGGFVTDAWDVSNLSGISSDLRDLQSGRDDD